MKELLDLWKRCPECSPKDLSWVESLQAFRMDFDSHGIDWEIMPDDYALAIACDHLERWLIKRGYTVSVSGAAGDGEGYSVLLLDGPLGSNRLVFGMPNDEKATPLISAVNAVLDREANQ